MLIENDRTVRATIPSGRSSLVSTGLIALNECYMRTTQFDAAGNDLTETLATQSMDSLLNPDCDPTMP